MTKNKRVLILTTLQNEALLSDFSGSDKVIVPIEISQELVNVLNDLNEMLDTDPLTSLAKGRTTWIPIAQELGNLIRQTCHKTGLPNDLHHIIEQFPQIFVATDRVIPIDLIPCRDTLLGIECVVAHQVASAPSEIKSLLSRALNPQKIPLRRVAHVSTYYPGETSLYDMDVIAATLKVNNKFAIEHYIYPKLETAKGLFGRTDVDILHIESHGTATSLQLDNPRGISQDVIELYATNGPSVYFFLGCEVGSRVEAISPLFVKKGAKATLGAYSKFLSGGESGEVSTSVFYDELYQGLLNGKSLGESVRLGRKSAAPDRIYYCAWLLFGNPNISFQLRRYGRYRY